MYISSIKAQHVCVTVMKQQSGAIHLLLWMAELMLASVFIGNAYWYCQILTLFANTIT